jgi:hypothetical protein
MYVDKGRPSKGSKSKQNQWLNFSLFPLSPPLVMFLVGARRPGPRSERETLQGAEYIAVRVLQRPRRPSSQRARLARYAHEP